MKITDLPLASSSSPDDLITIVQGGQTKTITTQTLLSQIAGELSRLTVNVNSLGRTTTNYVNKSTPFFNNPVTAAEPTNEGHLTTKGYVDNSLFNTVKNDGTTKLLSTLSFLNAPELSDNDNLALVHKDYVDRRLRRFLGVPSKFDGAIYPSVTFGGRCFIFTKDYTAFAVDGPEIQSGDILISLEASEGGTHGEVGHQFAIINTNIVFATETSAGILTVASADELLSSKLDSDTSALTPLKYKTALEGLNSHQRKSYAVPNVTLTEDDAGLIAVDTTRNSVTVHLPSITELSNPKLSKFTIKDEKGNAVKNNIIIMPSGGDSMNNALRRIISTDRGAMTFYNDGDSKWYVESTATTDLNTIGAKSVLTDDAASGEKPTTTGEYEAVMTLRVDLREYPIGTGFKIVAHSLAKLNANNKAVAIDVGGVLSVPSTLLGAAPQTFIHQELTIMHSTTPKTFGFGFVSCAGTTTKFMPGLSNTLDLNWDGTVSISVVVNNTTSADDLGVFALQVIPLK